MTDSPAGYSPPQVHAVFAQLYGTERLWATVGGGLLKPPWREGLPRGHHICHAGVQVRTTPSWPRSWANFSLF
jgi:hypothetical protein